MKPSPFFLLFSTLFLSNFITHESLATERPGMAVYEISIEEGMRLTPAALKNIEVKTRMASNAEVQSVPSDSIVHFQNQMGIFRLRKGWFKLISIKIIKKNELTTVIRSADIQIGDELVVEGAALLRVSEMDVFGRGE